MDAISHDRRIPVKIPLIYAKIRKLKREKLRTLCLQLFPMRKSLLTVLALGGFLSLVAQDALPFAHPFVPGTDAATINNPWGAGIPDISEIINGRYYRYAEFSTLPNGEERKALKANGVDLLYFQEGTTYIASIAAGTQFPLASDANLKRLSFIPAKSKMMKELQVAIDGNTFPSYALDNLGNVGITFTYYKDIPHNIALDQLKSYSVTYSNPNSHRVTAWMKPEEITRFCMLSFVCSAELIDDIPVPDNNVGRTNHRDNWMAQEFSGGRQYNGAGVNVMLQDDGIIGPHIDYTGRLQAQYITFNTGNHGDHCAGIIMGGGNLDPLTRGMGWGANIYVYGAVPYTGWDSIYSHYYTNNIVITSTSYSDGCNAGYTTRSQDLDQMAVDLPNYINVFSAGNNGGVDCQYGAGTAYGNITGGHKASKNSIAVGNLDYLDNLNSSSSVGPVHDGRLKPEVCAVGTNVYSTVDANDYEYKTGTSMSCPAVSGTFSELYNAYQVVYGSTPKSGLMKAILMNTCDDLDNAGPDFKTGYGRINGRKAVKLLEDGNFLTDSIDNAQTNTHSISVPANTGELKVMIYWHDYPAAVSASVALVNNLNMTVTTPSSSVVQPWVLDYTPTVAALSSPAVHGTDIRNNHEQVTIDNPAAGTYTVTINGAAVPMGPQTYFLVWYFEPADELVVTYPNGGEGFAPGEGQTIRWDAQVDTGSVDLFYTVDAGTTWDTIAIGVSTDALAYNWAVPVAMSGMCKVKIASATNSDVSDTLFTIIPIPANLNVAWACPDSLCLKWDTIAGATSYDVFTLGSVYMDSIANTSRDSVVITGLNNFTNTYWYSVRAREAATAAVGRRAIALEKSPGVFCPGTFDAAVTSIISPLQNSVGCMNVTNLPVVVSITNPGLTSISNVPVSYEFDNGGAFNEVYAGTIAAGATVTHTFATTVTMAMPGAHTLDVWTSLPADIVTTNDTFYYQMSYFANTIAAPPYSENFETFTTCGVNNDCGATNCTLINGWFNVPNGQGDDIDWRTDEGGTVTSNTGPTNDFAPGTATGNYLYLESSSCDNSTAEMISPCIDLTTFQNPKLLFGYHMYGSGMGSLYIDIYSNGAWINNFYVRNGSQSQNWLQATLSLSAFQGQYILIRFRGVTGTSGLSDMAVDFVRVEDPTGTPEYNAASNISVYPNPANGLFNFSTDGLNNENVSAKVYDISGRVVFDQDYGTQFGTFNSAIDLSGFENGTYFLEVTIGESVAIQRLVKEE